MPSPTPKKDSGFVYQGSRQHKMWSLWIVVFHVFPLPGKDPRCCAIWVCLKKDYLSLNPWWIVNCLVKMTLIWGYTAVIIQTLHTQHSPLPVGCTSAVRLGYPTPEGRDVPRSLIMGYNRKIAGLKGHMINDLWSCFPLSLFLSLFLSLSLSLSFSLAFSMSFSISFKQTQPRAIFSTLLYLYLSDLCYPYIPDHPRIYPMDSSINIYLPATD